MNDERWSDFCYQFIETGWFDYDRHKTIEAMRKLAERIPEDVLDNLPALTVCAPSARLLGRVFMGETPRGVFLYLSPRLEALAQAEVNWTVAHEFAHVALGHYSHDFRPGGPCVTADGDVVTERDADQLAAS